MRQGRALASCALAVAAGCGAGWKDVSQSLADPESGASTPRRDRQRTYYDREATRPRSEVAVLLYLDGRSVKDGLERSWTPEGKLEFERGWRAGEPDGLWRTWWTDGTPRFEYRYGAQPALMRWWHQDGTLSSWGPALNGVREGAWRGRHVARSPAFEGSFEAGHRAGAWTFWHPDGSLSERGEYERGIRVGTWEAHAQGDVPNAAPAWPDEP